MTSPLRALLLSPCTLVTPLKPPSHWPYTEFLCGGIHISRCGFLTVLYSVINLNMWLHYLTTMLGGSFGPFGRNFLLSLIMAWLPRNLKFTGNVESSLRQISRTSSHADSITTDGSSTRQEQATSSGYMVCNTWPTTLLRLW